MSIWSSFTQEICLLITKKSQIRKKSYIREYQQEGDHDGVCISVQPQKSFNCL